MNTATVSLAVTPTVLSTLVSHVSSFIYIIIYFWFLFMGFGWIRDC
jgi:hypothetical protein